MTKHVGRWFDGERRNLDARWSAMRRDLVPGFCWKSAEFVVDLFE
jgi:hypothetical protein